MPLLLLESSKRKAEIIDNIKSLLVEFPKFTVEF